MRFIARCLIAAVATTVGLPAAADAASRRLPRRGHHRTARIHAPEHGERQGGVCLDTPVEVVARGQTLRFSLARCDGTPAPLAALHLTTLARAAADDAVAPTSSRARRPTARAELRHPATTLDAGLVERLERIVDHVRARGRTARIVLVADRPSQSPSSYHARGRALDFRVEGVENVALVDFCKTLPDTGCGYFPNESFVHIDVRDPGTGHVAWTDSSRPGEPSRFSREADRNLPSLPGRRPAGGVVPGAEPDGPSPEAPADEPPAAAPEHDPALHTL